MTFLSNFEIQVIKCIESENVLWVEYQQGKLGFVKNSKQKCIIK